MAKELKKEDFNQQDGCYRNMSRMTGTLRYMAPEVWLGQPYNTACDVYSFAIMLWEIMALELPLAKFKGRDDFVKQVVEGGARPCTKKKESSWPETITDIMHKSWSGTWQDRYTMAEISDLLRHELIGLRGGDDQGLDHQHRRSTFVFCREAIHESLCDLDLSSELMDLGESVARSSGSRSMGRAILDRAGSERTCPRTSMGSNSARTSASSARSSGYSARSSGYSSRSSASSQQQQRLSSGGGSWRGSLQQQRLSGSSRSPHRLPGDPRRINSRHSESPMHQIPEKIEMDQSSTTSQ